MAEGLATMNLAPIYLIYSTISPRNEAIARLTRAGWHFLIGAGASDFTQCLLGLDLAKLLGDPEVQALIERKVNEMMIALMTSHGFQAAIESAARRPPIT
jgi:hypothetical protein